MSPTQKKVKPFRNFCFYLAGQNYGGKRDTLYGCYGKMAYNDTEREEWARFLPYFIDNFLKYIMHIYKGQFPLPSHCHTSDFGLYIELLVAIIVGESASGVTRLGESVIQTELNKLMPAIARGLNFFPLVGGLITGPNGYVVVRAQIKDDDIQIAYETYYTNKEDRSDFRRDPDAYLRFFTDFLLHTTKLIDDVFEALHGKYGVGYRLPKRLGLDSTVRIESDATFQSGPPSITGLYIRNDGKNGLNIAELDSEYYRLVYHPSRSVLADKRIIKTSPVDPSDIVDPKADHASDMETEESRR